ncbi:MAG: hypothetical protein IJP61_13105 [Treponema sp.]|nr:hypothetical protein [Treponema sp.]
MTTYDAFRSDVATTVKFFRPVLAALNIRCKEKQDVVYLAEFDHLDFLNLDNCVVTVLLADLKHASGMFFCREENGYMHCYIVIQNQLYAENMELVKIVGVHEFCHFMAIVYSITATSIEKQRKLLELRLQTKVDDLSRESLNRFYKALVSGKMTNDIPELEDEHYRLQCEGNTINYELLFKHFMFSKELFEKYFTDSDRENFKSLVNSDNDTETEQALRLFLKRIKQASEEKAVPYKLAFKQALNWVKDYIA